MDAYYFREINLPFGRKAALIAGLMRFIAGQLGTVPRNDDFFKRFISESRAPSWLREQSASDPWLLEHVGRLFWVCTELGLLKYQFPYPHKGQTYLPTRAGRIVARAPQNLVAGFWEPLMRSLSPPIPLGDSIGFGMLSRS